MATTLLLMLLFSSCTAFNIDVVYPVVYNNPTEKVDSYFGYSVQMLRTNSGQKKWILVGAPKSNSSHSEHLNITEPGKLYRCGFNDLLEDFCEPVLVDPTDLFKYTKSIKFMKRNFAVLGRDVNRTVPGRNFIDRKDFSWLGGSVAATNPESGKVTVCSHRWANKIHHKYTYFTNGACYVSDHDVPVDSAFTKLLPLVNGSMQYISDASDPHNGLYFYGFGEAGFSLHMTGDPDKSTEEIIVGAPAVLWTGSVIRLKDGPSSSGDFSDVVVGHPNTSWFHYHDYLGYSVHSGKFLGGDRIHYTSGAPRASRMKGAVFLFDFGHEELIVHAKVEGYQTGEYFGASLLAMDVNYDGLDDLIIGAPMHSTNPNSATIAGDEGKLYVFKNEGNWVFQRSKGELSGNKAKGARFGSAIANVGRLSSSSFNDIAVGAPYEEDAGAVYIYHTGPDGVSPKYSQRIAASGFPFTLKGFGISISAADIDGNQYPDLAIGSYLTSQVVLLRSHPVVTTQTVLTASPPKLNPDTGLTRLKICSNYTTKANEPADICVSIAVVLDFGYPSSRLVMEAEGTNRTSHSFTIVVNKPDTICREFPVYLGGTNADFSRHVVVRANTTLLSPDCRPIVTENQGMGTVFVPNQLNKDGGASSFCSTCPVSDRRERTFVDLKLPFVTGCKNDTRCESDLSLEASLLNSPLDIPIGLLDYAVLRAVVTNYKDPAYMTRLDVVLPQDVNLRKIPEQCISATGSSTNKYSCSLGNPLITSAVIDFELDLSEIKSGTEKMTFHLEANTTSSLVPADGHSNTVQLAVRTRTIVNVTISGRTDVEQKFYWKSNDTSEGTKTVPFWHLYEFTNRGSPLNQARLDLAVPTDVDKTDGVITIAANADVNGYHDDQPIVCITENTDRSLTDQSTELPSSRTKRNALSATEADANYVMPQNRTTVLSCSSAGVGCSIISCTIGSIQKNSRITVNVSGLFLISNIGPTLGNRDVVVFSTDATAVILFNETTSPSQKVSTMTYIIPHGGPPSEFVAAWIIGVAVAAAIILLIIIVIILIKCGFFKRLSEEEMEEIMSKKSGKQGHDEEEEPNETQALRDH